MSQNISPTPDNFELEREVAALYEENAARLIRYANSLTNKCETGCDAVQEVFLRYFAERRYGHRVDNPRAWLYRALHNYLMDQLKSPASRFEVPDEGVLERSAQDGVAERLLEQTQTAEQISSRLTPRELDCLRLRVEGLTYGQIARQLGICSGTVGALLPRVYAKLREDVAQGSLVREGTAGALGLLLNRSSAHAC